MSRTARNLVTFAGAMALAVGGAMGGCSDGPTKPGDAGTAGAGGNAGTGMGTGGSGTSTGGTSGGMGGAGGTLGPVRLDASGTGGSGGTGGGSQPDASAIDFPTGVIPPGPPGTFPPGPIDAGTGERPRDRLCTPADMARPDGACPHRMVVACRPTEPGAPEWCICFPPPLDGKWHCGKEPPPAGIAGR